ncbi:hypothetical protein PQE75_gp023 [Bacillus phage vB_BcoS-136]|uniref:GGDEF domain-containing protein n=1 Tax=Bacillus phage vB_BcoS-136 TaxID=2419619 RepID=A0A3G3BV91_9CAUD|nr:hypothetical protein PQE75_gp023 [Bacillus phage vB_BcoS-136]AYP68155.1 hypothetical protein vBBcoS136_00023 [Bacillus phage vB_BcoS-136]
MEEINGRYKIPIPCPDGIVGCAVIHKALVDVDAFNNIHDCYYDVYGFKPTETVIALIYKQLPREIHDLGKQWGWNDTEVGDKVYRWMKDRVVIVYGGLS